MESLVRLLVIMAASFIPSYFILQVVFRSRRNRLSRSEPPFRELRRRPPGESLRVKLADFDEKIALCVVMLIVPPVLFVIFVWYEHPPSWVAIVPPMLVVAGAVAAAGVTLHRVVRQRDNYRLGWDGERFVGEELNRLMSDGFEVYHDVPFDGFNMDHVLVGARGVFVVETKTRRKPKGESGGKQFHVDYDGSSLRWPWGCDTHGLEQAKNNARTLSKWLSSAVGESVYVSPILTLPGWMVDRRVSDTGIGVLNPKEIWGFCISSENKLNETMTKRICHQLNQKCRLGLSPPQDIDDEQR